jgi:P3 major capsid protein
MPAPAATQNAQSSAMSIQQINSMQRKQVLSSSVRMKQSIYSATFNPSNGNNIVNVNTIRPVGLILRFIVEVSATIAEIGSGKTATATDFAEANLLSQIQFTDLQNNQRHLCSGLQLIMTESFKKRQPFTSALTMAQAPSNFGANWTIAQNTPPTDDATGSARCIYEIPIAYSDDDLRGAIYANVVSNQMNLQLTVNPNPVPNAGDDTFAVFTTNDTSPGSITSVTINVYQEYLDQLPQGKTGIVLPVLDVSTLYQLQFTNFVPIVAGQDNYFQYASFRRFMSVMMIYNDTGTAGGRVTGGDINYLAQVSANLTNLFKVGPLESARITRLLLTTDPPPGLYYFPSRRHPIYTLSSGNMQLDLNPISAGDNAYAYMMWEYFAEQNTLSQAGSLPASS